MTVIKLLCKWWLQCFRWISRDAHEQMLHFVNSSHKFTLQRRRCNFARNITRLREVQNSLFAKSFSFCTLFVTTNFHINFGTFEIFWDWNIWKKYINYKSLIKFWNAECCEVPCRTTSVSYFVLFKVIFSVLSSWS